MAAPAEASEAAEALIVLSVDMRETPASPAVKCHNRSAKYEC
jgi:hypothetical protein